MAETKSKNLRKLCLMNLNTEEDDETFQTLCENFGTVVRFNRHPLKRLAFVLYVSER